MKKQLLEDCQRLHISELRSSIPKGAITVVLEIGGEKVVVTGRLTNLRNGYRYSFLCPECGKPYESLYKSDFSIWKCRVCIDGVYASCMRK